MTIMAIEETAPFIAGDPVMVRDNGTHPWMQGEVTAITHRPGNRNFGRNWVVTVRVQSRDVVVVVDCNGRCYYNGSIVVQGGVGD